MELRLFKEGLVRADKRKLRTIFLNVLYGMSSQMSSLFLSLISIYFFSKHFWGEYNKILVPTYVFLIVGVWGNKEFLTAGSTDGFRKQFSSNLISRSGVLLACLVLVCLTCENYIAVSILLTSRFYIQCFDIVISKERKFKSVLWLELSVIFAFLLCSLISSSITKVNFEMFLTIVLTLEVVKCLIYLKIFTAWWWPVNMSEFSFFQLRKSFPFLLTSMIGFFTGRLDYVLSSLYLKASDLATYQVMFNFVFLILVLANLIFSPYAFQFYRLKPKQKRNFMALYFLAGSIISLTFLCSIRQILRFYQIETDLYSIMALSCFAALSFFYQPYVYGIYKMDRAIYVSGIGVLSMLVFLAAIYVFKFYATELLIFHFIYSALFAQIFRAILFFLIGRIYLRAT